MKLNLKVRMKNPVFWLTFIPALATFVYTVLALFGITPSVGEDAFVKALKAIVTALATLGVLVDPTTKGIVDGTLGSTYDEPQ